MIKERNTPAAEVMRAATTGYKKVAFANLPPTLQKLSLMRAMAKGAFDALCAVRKTQARVLDDDDTPLDVLATMQRQKKRKAARSTNKRQKKRATS